MKVIKYNLCSVVTQSKEKPRVDENSPIEYEYFTEEILTPVIMGWNEINEETAKREAHNGEYTIEDDGVEKSKDEQIAELKEKLSATDYKVIKCAECQLLGEEMPYDVEALHAERQAIRDEINKLEEE